MGSVGRVWPQKKEITAVKSQSLECITIQKSRDRHQRM
uniref:Uncharacterized protein n=1 Tax=Rhizophora mucronata TaxID=61149 RepID=A0A2P2P4W7_RHIMU